MSAAKQVTYEMIAGGRIDGVISHTGAFLLEVDGRWEQVYNFRIVPCEGAQLTVYGTIKPDGQPDNRRRLEHRYLVELLGVVSNPDTPRFGQVKGRVEGADELEVILEIAKFGDSMPFMYQETEGRVGYLDVRRFVVTCNT